MAPDKTVPKDLIEIRGCAERDVDNTGEAISGNSVSVEQREEKQDQRFEIVNGHWVQDFQMNRETQVSLNWHSISDFSSNSVGPVGLEPTAKRL